MGGKKSLWPVAWLFNICQTTWPGNKLGQIRIQFISFLVFFGSFRTKFPQKSTFEFNVVYSLFSLTSRKLLPPSTHLPPVQYSWPAWTQLYWQRVDQLPNTPHIWSSSTKGDCVWHDLKLKINSILNNRNTIFNQNENNSGLYSTVVYPLSHWTIS